MPTYPYVCPDCEKAFDVIKRISDIDKIENCPQCFAICNKNNRKIARQALHDIDVDDPKWDHALGCVVKNSKHRKKIAKDRGLIEVGTESVENIEKLFSKKRDDIAKERYREFFDPIEVS